MDFFKEGQLFFFIIDLLVYHLSPSKYGVSIWNCASAPNIEILMKRALGHHYRISISKNVLVGKRMMHYVPMLHSYRNCIVLVVSQMPSKVINPNHCWALTIRKACASSAPPRKYITWANYTSMYQYSVRIFLFLKFANDSFEGHN